ncbi:uncharacterized protein LOC108665134 isoform X2 [Hyalella azteca]|uniref:Uncharacterized protein LOC108665134 isoform X2 n=1 Tax=Hyalella azteca TaxID=294128 RepID=A0A8B7N1K9_HYAAZ|nr:uncharacterized protein LOC108665134 isoform X2 [Hyalella azteca]
MPVSKCVANLFGRKDSPRPTTWKDSPRPTTSSIQVATMSGAQASAVSGIQAAHVTYPQPLEELWHVKKALLQHGGLLLDQVLLEDLLSSIDRKLQSQQSASHQTVRNDVPIGSLHQTAPDCFGLSQLNGKSKFLNTEQIGMGGGNIVSSLAFEDLCELGSPSFQKRLSSTPMSKKFVASDFAVPSNLARNLNDSLSMSEISGPQSSFASPLKSSAWDTESMSFNSRARSCFTVKQISSGACAPNAGAPSAGTSLNSANSLASQCHDPIQAEVFPEVHANVRRDSDHYTQALLSSKNNTKQTDPLSSNHLMAATINNPTRGNPECPRFAPSTPATTSAGVIVGGAKSSDALSCTAPSTASTKHVAFLSPPDILSSVGDVSDESESFSRCDSQATISGPSIVSEVAKPEQHLDIPGTVEYKSNPAEAIGGEDERKTMKFCPTLAKNERGTVPKILVGNDFLREIDFRGADPAPVSGREETFHRTSPQSKLVTGCQTLVTLQRASAENIENIHCVRTVVESYHSHHPEFASPENTACVDSWHTRPETAASHPADNRKTEYKSKRNRSPGMVHAKPDLTTNSGMPESVEIPTKSPGQNHNAGSPDVVTSEEFVAMGSVPAPGAPEPNVEDLLGALHYEQARNSFLLESLVQMQQRCARAEQLQRAASAEAADLQVQLKRLLSLHCCRASEVTALREGNLDSSLARDSIHPSNGSHCRSLGSILNDRSYHSNWISVLLNDYPCSGRPDGPQSNVRTESYPFNPTTDGPQSNVRTESYPFSPRTDEPQSNVQTESYPFSPRTDEPQSDVQTESYPFSPRTDGPQSNVQTERPPMLENAFHETNFRSTGENDEECSVTVYSIRHNILKTSRGQDFSSLSEDVDGVRKFNFDANRVSCENYVSNYPVDLTGLSVATCDIDSNTETTKVNAFDVKPDVVDSNPPHLDSQISTQEDKLETKDDREMLDPAIDLSLNDSDSDGDSPASSCCYDFSHNDGNETVRGKSGPAGCTKDRFDDNYDFVGNSDPVDDNNEPVDDNNDPVDNNNDPVDDNNDPVDHNNEPVDRNNDPVDHNNDPVDHYKDLVDHNNDPVDHYNDPVDDNNDPVDHYNDPVYLAPTNVAADVANRLTFDIETRCESCKQNHGGVKSCCAGCILVLHPTENPRHFGKEVDWSDQDRGHSSERSYRNLFPEECQATDENGYQSLPTLPQARDLSLEAPLVIEQLCQTLRPFSAEYISLMESNMNSANNLNADSFNTHETTRDFINNCPSSEDLPPESRNLDNSVERERASTKEIPLPPNSKGHASFQEGQEDAHLLRDIPSITAPQSVLDQQNLTDQNVARVSHTGNFIENPTFGCPASATTGAQRQSVRGDGVHLAWKGPKTSTSSASAVQKSSSISRVLQELDEEKEALLEELKKVTVVGGAPQARRRRPRTARSRAPEPHC